MGLPLARRESRRKPEAAEHDRWHCRSVQDQSSGSQGIRRDSHAGQSIGPSGQTNILRRPRRPLCPRGDFQQTTHWHRSRRIWAGVLYQHLLPFDAQPTHQTQVERLPSYGRETCTRSGMVEREASCAQIQRSHQSSHAETSRKSHAMGARATSSQPNGTRRGQGNQQAPAASPHSHSRRVFCFGKAAPRTVSNDGNRRSVHRAAGQRDPGPSLVEDRLREPHNGCKAGGRKRACQGTQDRVLGRRTPSGSRLCHNPASLESPVSLLRRGLGISESSHKSLLSRQSDPTRLHSDRWGEGGSRGRNRMAYLQAHLPCLAGCHRRTNRRAAKADAACAGINHNEHLWQRIDDVQAEGEQQSRAHGTSSCLAANKIEKGLLLAVPLQALSEAGYAYWTFLDLRRKRAMLVTLC